MVRIEVDYVNFDLLGSDGRNVIYQISSHNRLRLSNTPSVHWPVHLDAELARWSALPYKNTYSTTLRANYTLVFVLLPSVWTVSSGWTGAAGKAEGGTAVMDLSVAGGEVVSASGVGANTALTISGAAELGSIVSGIIVGFETGPDSPLTGAAAGV